MSNHRNTTLMGVQAIGQSTGAEQTARAPKVGSIVAAIDNYWGGGEFIYVQFAGAVREKALVSLYTALENGVYVTKAAEMPNAANTGRAAGVAVMPAANNEFGWVQIAGVTPVNSAAAIAADTVLGVAATGQVGANSAGKQLLGARVHAAATTTAVKVALGGKQGENTIKVANTDGWFVGAYVSGTGIAANAKILAINVDERTVTLSGNNTAPVSGNITCTYNNGAVYFPVVFMNRPLMQGAIT